MLRAGRGRGMVEARRRVEQAGAGRMDGVGMAKEARRDVGDDGRRVQGLGEAFPQ